MMHLNGNLTSYCGGCDCPRELNALLGYPWRLFWASCICAFHPLTLNFILSRLMFIFLLVYLFTLNIVSCCICARCYSKQFGKVNSVNFPIPTWHRCYPCPSFRFEETVVPTDWRPCWSEYPSHNWLPRPMLSRALPAPLPLCLQTGSVSPHSPLLSVFSP